MIEPPEVAPAKLNLALHVRGKLPDGRHRLETLFAFCVDGDLVAAAPSDDFRLTVKGRYAADVPDGEDNLALKAARALRDASDAFEGASITIHKNLPVASGIGGGSADAAAVLRMLTRVWSLDPQHASAVAPGLGADVPACLLSMTALGKQAGDALELFQDSSIPGTPVLLVNPGVRLSTKDVFAAWDGADHGGLDDWRAGRNDLEAPARLLAPEIGKVLEWLGEQDGANFVRMSGSGATCFALFDREEQRDVAAAACPGQWWHLATFLR